MPSTLLPSDARTHIHLETDRWMKQINDSTPLSLLSIPGSYKSASKHGWAFSHQQLSIYEQLHIGIRFLDIRCKANRNAHTFEIYPGFFHQKISFESILQDCSYFLKNHSQETILLKIKQENSKVTDDVFGDIFQTYLKLFPVFYLETGIPELKHVRGKIVLISDNHGLPGGLHWKDALLFDKQDKANATFSSFEIKWEHIKEHAIKAQRTLSQGKSDKIYINSVNTSALGRLETPEYFAKKLNPQLIEFLSQQENKRGPYGIISMDFPSQKLVTAIIRTNPAYVI